MPEKRPQQPGSGTSAEATPRQGVSVTFQISSWRNHRLRYRWACRGRSVAIDIWLLLVAVIFRTTKNSPCPDMQRLSPVEDVAVNEANAFRGAGIADARPDQPARQDRTRPSAQIIEIFRWADDTDEACGRAVPRRIFLGSTDAAGPVMFNGWRRRLRTSTPPRREDSSCRPAQRVAGQLPLVLAVIQGCLLGRR